MTNNDVLSLYKYNTWANATMLNHLKQLPETKDNTLAELGIKQQLLANDFDNFIVSNDMSCTELFSGVRMSYGDVIFHLINHGTYHRGNITAMLHQLGHKGVPTDYGLYLYQQAAHT